MVISFFSVCILTLLSNPPLRGTFSLVRQADYGGEMPKNRCPYSPSPLVLASVDIAAQWTFPLSYSLVTHSPCI